ncbi:MAG: ABC transporter substrate-binding protein [Chloroflexi bacterium]|nr:ABC transporter substrate-binding protein [Chloroflexota bacterium]
MNKIRLLSAFAVLLLAVGLAGAQMTPRGGTVVVSDGEQLVGKNFNPFSPDPLNFTDRFIYEPMLIFNPVDGGVATPWLATGYEYAEDLQSVTFNIREGVMWSDGEMLDSGDVAFTFNLFLTVPATDIAAIRDFLESVEVIDDSTVQFNLNRVYTLAHELIGSQMIVPEHNWADVEDYALFTNSEPVGTGAMTTVADFNEQSYTLCRNENYWRMDESGAQLPYVDCIRQVLFQGNDPANLALINGELDWVGNFVPDIEQTFIAQNPDKHGYYFWPGGATVQLYSNTSKEPFSDVNFRRALSMAIDYEAVTSIGMYGYTSPANAVGLGPRYDSWVSADATAYADSTGQTRYNPDGAMALLDESGYVDSDGDGIRNLPGGDNIDFKVQVVNGWTDWVTSVQIMSQNFQDVGLSATVETPDFGAWFSALQNATYEVSIGWGTAGNTPYNYFRNLLLSELISDEGVANAETWSRWTSDEADALLSAFTETADAAQHMDIVNQLQMLYVENMPAIPLFPGPTWYEYTTYRFTGFPTEDNYYAQGSPWERNSAAIVISTIHCIDDMACGQ